MTHTRWSLLGLSRLALLTATMSIVACGTGRKEPEPEGAKAPTPAATDSLAGTAAASAGGGVATASSETRPTVLPHDSAWTAAATTPFGLRLEAIGYPSGITLLGSLDEAALTIPVNPGLAPTSLTLTVIPTPGMPAATLILQQRDRILAQRALSDTTTSITFPLTGVTVVDGRASLSLALAVPGRDVCEAQRYYRTVLTGESRVAFAGVPTAPGGINGFFAPWVDTVTFYLAEQPSLDAAQAALDASAFVARRYRGMATRFVIKPLPADGTPITEPGPFSRALVWSAAGTTALVQENGTHGTMLALSARRDARQLFTLADGDALVAANGFRGTTVSLDHNTPIGGAGSLTFADLGFASRTLEGSSLLIGAYPFALADLGGGTMPTSFRLVARHSVLPPNGNGSVRIHLNGSLIQSRALDRAALDVTVPLPTYLLRRDNVLEVRFQVTLGDGACVLGGSVFTATIDEASAFVTERGAPLAPGFARFPSSFVPAFSVLLEPRDRFRVELAAATIGAMQQTTHTPLAPALARDAKEAVGPLLAVGTSNLADVLVAPIHSGGFRLRDKDGRLWDEFTPDAPYAAMQGWSAGGRDILLLHHTGDNGMPLQQLLEETLASYGWFGTRGDVVVRGVNGPARPLTLANAGWRIERLPDTTSSWLARYRTVILVVSVLVVLGLLWWLYPRVVRRELDPAG
ncbi:MAG: cellulose biosynthesis cyclic di-GMP-binding regulatory protein BcsB [Gemmatimonadales bacterium]|nr:cellulose biosynthesis cyclic di-GMP-binding regulatory protein BcsB [Gemmatimonadota bacterium]MBP6442632.1 cellulose biosynthesis cyclic di-GMP-binding regulatory protein BcsB [Gemmatimonadales bacterium]